MSRPRAQSSFVVRITLCVWAAMIAGLGALLVFKHEVPLDETALGQGELAARIAHARGHADVGKWLALHVLYEGCGCSARVLDSLVGHLPEPGVAERIVLVSDGKPPPNLEKARALGYEIETVSRAELAKKYGIEAVPALALVSPTESLEYLGGYSRRKRGPVMEDRDVVRRTVAGERVEPLPTFGCAVGARLAERESRLF